MGRASKTNNSSEKPPNPIGLRVSVWSCKTETEAITNPDRPPLMQPPSRKLPPRHLPAKLGPNYDRTLRKTRTKPKDPSRSQLGPNYLTPKLRDLTPDDYQQFVFQFVRREVTEPRWEIVGSWLGPRFWSSFGPHHWPAKPPSMHPPSRKPPSKKDPFVGRSSMGQASMRPFRGGSVKGDMG